MLFLSKHINSFHLPVYSKIIIFHVRPAPASTKCQYGHHGAKNRTRICLTVFNTMQPTARGLWRVFSPSVDAIHLICIGVMVWDSRYVLWGTHRIINHNPQLDLMRRALPLLLIAPMLVRYVISASSLICISGSSHHDFISSLRRG